MKIYSRVKPDFEDEEQEYKPLSSEDIDLFTEQELKKDRSDQKELIQFLIGSESTFVISTYEEGTYHVDTDGVIYYTVRTSEGFYRILVNNYLTKEVLIRSNGWDDIKMKNNASLIVQDGGIRSLHSKELIALGRINDFNKPPFWILNSLSDPQDKNTFDLFYLEHMGAEISAEKKGKENSTSPLSGQYSFLQKFSPESILEKNKSNFPLTSKVNKLYNNNRLDSVNINYLANKLTLQEQLCFIYHSFDTEYIDKNRYLIEELIYFESLSTWHPYLKKIFLERYSLKHISPVKGSESNPVAVKEEYDLSSEGNPFEKVETILRQLVIGITDNYDFHRSENESISAIALSFKIGYYKLGLYAEGGIGGGIGIEANVDKLLQVSSHWTLTVGAGVDVKFFETGINYSYTNHTVLEYESIQQYMVHQVKYLSNIDAFQDMEAINTYLSTPEHEEELKKRVIEIDKNTHQVKYGLKFKNAKDDEQFGFEVLVKSKNSKAYEIDSNGVKTERSKPFMEKDKSRSLDFTVSLKFFGINFKAHFLNTKNNTNGNDNGKYLTLSFEIEVGDIIKNEGKNFTDFISIIVFFMTKSGSLAFSNVNNLGDDSTKKEDMIYNDIAFELLNLIKDAGASLKDFKIPSKFANAFQDIVVKEEDPKKLTSKIKAVNSFSLEMSKDNKGKYHALALNKTNTTSFEVNAEVERKLAEATGGFYGGFTLSGSQSTTHEAYIFDSAVNYLSTQVNGLIYESDDSTIRETRHRIFTEAQNLYLSSKVGESEELIANYWKTYKESYYTFNIGNDNKEGKNKELIKFYLTHSKAIEGMGRNFIQMLKDMVKEGIDRNFNKLGIRKEFSWDIVNTPYMSGIDAKFMSKYVCSLGPLSLVHGEGEISEFGKSLVIPNKNTIIKKGDQGIMTNYIFPLLFQDREKYNFDIFHYKEN